MTAIKHRPNDSPNTSAAL